MIPFIYTCSIRISEQSGGNRFDIDYWSLVISSSTSVTVRSVGRSRQLFKLVPIQEPREMNALLE